MPWMRLEGSLLGHRKVRKLGARIGVSEPTARGLVVGLWLRVLAEAPDGNLDGWDPEDLAFAAEADKCQVDAESFRGALLEVGLLDEGEEGTLFVHDWDEFTNSYGEAAARAARRKRKEEAKPAKRARASKSGGGVRGQSADSPDNGADNPRTVQTPSQGWSGQSAGRTDGRTDGQDGQDGRTGPAAPAAAAPRASAGAPSPADGGVTRTLFAPEVVDAEIVSPDDEVVETLPAKGGQTFGVTRRLVKALEKAYPEVDVMKVVAEAQAAVLADPAKMTKTLRGWPDCLRTWCRAKEEKAERDQAWVEARNASQSRSAGPQTGQSAAAARREREAAESTRAFAEGLQRGGVYGDG